MLLSGDPYSQSNSFRQRRFAMFLRMAEEVVAERGGCRVLDLGGTALFWSTFGQRVDPRIEVSLLNLPGTHPTDLDPKFSYLTGDACSMPELADGSFDIVHSNSVIEHVGLWDRMVSFANEVRRMAPRYFVQTPNYWFPIEAHARLPYFHLLPEPWRAAMLMRRPRGYLPGAKDIAGATRLAQDSFLLTSQQLEALFPDATVHREKVFGLTKSLIAIRG